MYAYGSYPSQLWQNSTGSLGRTLPIGGPRSLVASSLTLLLRFLRLKSGHRIQAKSGPQAEPFKDTNTFTVHHGVPEMSKSKKAKREGLEKHRQQQREKKQKAKARKNVSLPAKHRKR